MKIKLDNQPEKKKNKKKNGSGQNNIHGKKISWRSKLIGAAGEDHQRQESETGFQGEKAEWLLQDKGADISIPMNRHKETQTKPGKEAPFLLPSFQVHLYLSAASATK